MQSEEQIQSLYAMEGNPGTLAIQYEAANVIFLTAYPWSLGASCARTDWPTVFKLHISPPDPLIWWVTAFRTHPLTFRSLLVVFFAHQYGFTSNPGHQLCDHYLQYHLKILPPFCQDLRTRLQSKLFHRHLPSASK